MQQLVLFHGLKRSGNHAVINWLLGQKPYVFYNNIIPVAPILLGQKPFPPQVPLDRWLSAKVKFWPRRVLAFRGKSVLVSLEDHPTSLRPFSRIGVPTINILLLRDVRNLLASRIRKSSRKPHPAYPKSNDADMQRVVGLWKDHAREFLGETDHLAHRVCVYFDAWFVAEDYRREVSRQLGLAFSDAGLSQVSRMGGGSSFDSTQYDGNSAQMQVLDRVDALSADERAVLDEVLADTELLDLQAAIDARVPEQAGDTGA